jgi:hypothetical protein
MTTMAEKAANEEGKLSDVVKHRFGAKSVAIATV